MRNTHSTNHVNPLIRLILVQTIAITFTLSCSGGDGGDENGGNSGSPPSVTKDTFTDSRDNKSYETVKIGTQTWMAENLNVAASGSKCGDGESLSDGNTSTCDTYGRLYDWETAKAACPSDWHLPSDAEWTTLENSVGGSFTAGTKLKAKSGWNSNGNGEDTYDFSALPGGYGSSYGGFNGVGYRGRWWSATVSDASRAWRRRMSYIYASVDRAYNDKTSLYSVRCVQD
jgi:uncharacterized protein (TIGR02145 family)